jgi:hypothetical protein
VTIAHRASHSYWAVIAAAALVGVLLLIIRPFGGGGSEVPAPTLLPAHTAVFKLDLGNANVEVSPANGAPTIDAGGADLRVKSRGHVVSVRCAAGKTCSAPKIHVALPIAASLQLMLGRGSATVRKMRGPIDLQSQSAALNIFDGGSHSVALRTSSGAVHVSLAAIAPTLAVKTVSGPIYLTVPYDHSHGGYSYVARSNGQVLVDMTRSHDPGAARIEAISTSGDVSIAQRYPNMS